MRRRPLPVLVAVLVVAVAAFGCSDGDGDDAVSTTTGVGSQTAVPGTSLPGESTSTASSAPAPPPASVLPPPVTEAGAPGSAVSCDALRRALPVADLLPRDLGSWPAERQRVVVDARLNAALYQQAAAAGPESLRSPLGALESFATFVADESERAVDVAAALAAIDGYPQQGEVAAATVEVDRWVRVNCP